MKILNSKRCTSFALINTKPLNINFYFSNGLGLKLKKKTIKPILHSGTSAKFICSLGGFVLTSSSKRLWAHVRASRYSLHKKKHSFPDANLYKKNLLKKYLSLNSRPVTTMYRSFQNQVYSTVFLSNYFSYFKNEVNLSFIDSFKSHSLDKRIRRRHSNRPSRIRLQPGYIRIWKQARHSFRVVARLKYRYEHRLTRYFLKRAYHAQASIIRYRSIFVHSIPKYSKSLYIVLVRCNFAADFQLSFLLLNAGVVYLNTNLVENRYLTLLDGDFLQLVVSSRFYVLFRFQQARLLTRKSRILKFARIKFKPKTSRLGRDVNYSYPDWIMNFKYNSSDVPGFMEVDFFSLSVFFIPDPFIINSRFSYNHDDTPINPFSMYNWKYIT